MVTVNVLRFLLILSCSSHMESKLLTNLCFCSLTAYFRKVDMYHYQGLASGRLTQQEALTQLATFVYACRLLGLLWAVACCASDAEYLDIGWPLYNLHRIAWRGKLSQSLRFKLDHLSNCLLQFIVEENTTTLSHPDLLQGDVEDIVVQRGGMMPFVLILLWSSK